MNQYTRKLICILLAWQLAIPAFGIERGVGGQKLTLQVIDSATGRPKTGDAANLTAYVSGDGDTSPDALGDTSATELSSTNLPGVYQFDLTAAETNFANAVYGGKSSTSGCDVIARQIWTTPPTFSLLQRPGNTYYIDDTDGNGDLGTYDAPYDSWSQLTGVVTLKAGDIVHFRAGSYSGAISNTVSGITIEGDGMDSTTLTHTATTLTVSANNVTVRGLKIAGTGSSGTGVLSSSSTTGNVIENCWLDCVFDGVFSSGYNIVIRGCKFGDITRTGVYDQIAISNGSATIDHCNFWTDGAFSSVDTAAVYVASGAEAQITNCDFILFSSASITSGRAAMCIRTESASVTAENCDFTINYQSASNTGTVAAIGRASWGSSDRLTIGIEDCNFNIITNALGGLTPKQVDASTSGSRVTFSGGNLAEASCNGWSNIYENDGGIKPATNHRTIAATSSSTVPIDLTQSNGSDTTGEQLQNLDTAVSQAVSATAVSPFLIAKGHSWKFDNPTQATAPNNVVENTGFDDMLFEMDFSGALNTNASINTITTVSIADVGGATEPTVVSSTKRADSKAVHIKLDGVSATATTYTVSVKITTTDNQVMTRKGRLVVQ